ncbi:hypothetical protein BCR32DRAFT_296148 [Anaeromyces robustus]|uniref:Uncharacterized protein n=1 Tax=Anaeromyces robustus TaxID=1754192 RepID=A0A1Y1WT34_9FUNG|nr:hypothetical protein BCR32DRAFT_296148 [Anaeromyces robustus]|eukprot:ORX76612.1 hypothetical protein BCR32DRAFT_296148 [Anaeromyces robustus]
MTKLNKLQRKDLLEELRKQENLMEMDVLHYKDNDQRRQDGFQKTILAIQNIVSRKLYKACAPSLEVYFRDVWKISRAQVYRFLDCATVLNTLEGFKVRPSKERLCRSLKRHGKSPTNIRNLWTLVKIRASDREITSTLIGKCWEEIVTSGREVKEDPIPKKKECKARKPKIDINNPSTIVIPSSNPNQKQNNTIKQEHNAFLPTMNPSYTTTSVVTVNNTTTVMPINNNTTLGTPLMNSNIYSNNTMNNTNTNTNTNLTTTSVNGATSNTNTNNNNTTSNSTNTNANNNGGNNNNTIINTSNNNGTSNNNNNSNGNIHNGASSLNTPTDQDPSLSNGGYYSANNNDNNQQKMLLQSLPTPTMSSSKTLYNGNGQGNAMNPNDINTTLSNMNSMNTMVTSNSNNSNSGVYGFDTYNNNGNINYDQNQNENKIISSYPSPTASHIISQQQSQQPSQQPSQQQQQQQNDYNQQYPTTVPSTQFLMKGNSPMPMQKMNFQMGSVIVNPSPSTTPIVDSAILDSSQQVLLNDPNNNNGMLFSSNGYPSTTLQGQDPSNGGNLSTMINQSYVPSSNMMQQQHNNPSPQTSSYQLVNPNCILSPTLQQNQQLSSQSLTIQTTYAQMPSYSMNQPQTPQSVFMNSNNSNMMDNNNMMYQPTPPKNMLYQSIQNQMSMQNSPVVYTVPPTPAQNVMLSPPSQSPVNYYNNYNMTEYQNGNNY